MSYQFLIEVDPMRQPKKIKIRVARIWEGYNPIEPNKLLSLELVGTDVKNNAMHFYVRDFDALLFGPMLKEGSLYSMSKFQVKNCKFKYNAVPGDYNICLTRATQLEELDEDPALYPRHSFNIMPYHTLYQRIKQDKYLTSLSAFPLASF